ncbi:MAG: hypothetical protein J0L81_10760 [Caulobacterales bacterium]|jgi:hypothetical protein|nr:hypothetical protein [Caulobacterales bacterium]
MRLMAALLALGLAACGPVVIGDGAGNDQTASAGGYTMEIRAGDNQQTYLITTPDGRTVGARAAEGASALMDNTRSQALAAEPPPQGEALPEQVSIRLPGFSLSVAGEDNGAESENGQVRISVGGEGGQQVVVNADEGGPGDADDLAYVRVSGADADAVREFIAEQEELSAEVKAQLIAELQLPPASENAAQ